MIVLAVAMGLYVLSQDKPPREARLRHGGVRDDRGPEPQPPPKKANPRPWPTYGYDDAAPAHLAVRPPAVRTSGCGRSTRTTRSSSRPRSATGTCTWRSRRASSSRSNAKTGLVDWRKSLGRCAASSPTIGKGVVYQSYMHHVVCSQDQAGADGFVVAWDAETGRELWRYKTAPVESSPLLHGNRLFFGSWDHGVHAINAKTGQRIWRFQANNQVNTSAAWWKGRIFIGRRQRHALRAQREDRQAAVERQSQRARHASSGTPRRRSPTGASTSATRTARCTSTARRPATCSGREPLGTYIYGAAAVYQPKGVRRHLRRKVLRARCRHGRRALGDQRGRRGARRADGDARPRLLRGLLELRRGGVARPSRAVPTPPTPCARATARACGASATGKYANPVVADGDRDLPDRPRAPVRVREARLEGREGVPAPGRAPGSGARRPARRGLGKPLEKSADASGHVAKNVDRSNRIAH